MSTRRRYAAVLLVLLVVLAAGSATAMAHPDPPGQPPVEVTVFVTGIAPTTDQDDGFVGYNWDAELEFDFTVTRGGIAGSTHSGLTGSRGEFDYDWDAYQGRLMDASTGGRYPVLYRHVECSPIDPLRVEVDVREDDSGDRRAGLSPNPSLRSFDDLGSGSTSVSAGDVSMRNRAYPGRKFENRVIDTGKAKVRIQVTTRELPDRAVDCSDPRRQPSDMASSISADSGGAIYDWQFANLVKGRIAKAGYANLVFVFDQCYAGGMLDDLSTLSGTGDVAALAAAAFDETAKMDGRSETDPQSHYSEHVNDEFEKTGSNAPTMRRVASRAEVRMESGPYERDRNVVHPQSVFYGDGEGIRLGRKTDGSAVKSRHAVLFAGDANHPAIWRDLDRAYRMLTKRHGFPADDVHVLADAGPKSSTKHLPKGWKGVPDYVDGPGTKAALYGTMRDLETEMNDDEQLVVWTMDHGNSERRSVAMKKAVEKPETVTLTPNGSSTWALPGWFLSDARADPDNEPFVSLVVVPGNGTAGNASTGVNGSTGSDAVSKSLPAEPPAWTRNVGVSLNDRDLERTRVEPVVWADADPDVDGYELVFPVPESLLARENAVAVDWRGETGTFEPYTVTTLQLSTGDVAKVPVAPETDESVSEAPVSEPPLAERFSARSNAVNRGIDEAPFPLRRVVAGERVLVTVERENGAVTTVGVVTAPDGSIEVVRPGLDDPTVVAWTDGATADAIADADDPVAELVEAVESGRIEYRGTSRWKRLVLGVARLVGGLL